MEPKRLFGPIKILSFVVLLLMGVAIIYAFAIGITYWTGIGV